MKKTFSLLHPKKQPARQLDAVKAEINKYLKRERGKPLPEGSDYWDFKCKCGSDGGEVREIHVAEISKSLDAVQASGAEACYVEILTKPAKRAAKKGTQRR
ncbi:MAG: DUF6172 family protein [Opitutales bacterium]